MNKRELRFNGNTLRYSPLSNSPLRIARGPLDKSLREISMKSTDRRECNCIFQVPFLARDPLIFSDSQFALPSLLTRARYVCVSSMFHVFPYFLLPSHYLYSVAYTRTLVPENSRACD